MTIKIEISDETWLTVYEAFLLKRTPRAGIEAAINTLLEAMVKEGTAKAGYGWETYGPADWRARDGVPPEGGGSFPVMLIRMVGTGDKP